MSKAKIQARVGLNRRQHKHANPDLRSLSRQTVSRRQGQAGDRELRRVRANEPGTKLYVAWQQKDDPTRFVHFFIFEDAAAHAVHASSSAVKQFEAAYGPELAEGSVVFTDYEVVAAKGIGE
jgi:quinol monooxygenase YgiN